jgi:hypothetical protein
VTDRTDRATRDPLAGSDVERAVAELLAGRGRPRAAADLPFRACPGCGEGLADTRSFVQEFWVAAETRFLVWCHHCHGTYTVVPIERFVGTEATD